MSNIDISINIKEFPMLKSIDNKDLEKICIDIFKSGYISYFLDKPLIIKESRSIMEQIHNINYIR
jgi:hypothetical protein